MANRFTLFCRIAFKNNCPSDIIFVFPQDLMIKGTVLSLVRNNNILRCHV